MARGRLGPFWIGLFAVAIVGSLRVTGCSQLVLLEERATDLRLLLGRTQGPPDPRLVIVAIDDASLREVGRWPWPRSTMAHLLRRIAEAQPKVVGIDIVQSEPSESPAGADEDRALAEALAEAPIYVLGYFFRFEPHGPPAAENLVRPYDVVHVRSQQGLRWIPPQPTQVAILTPNLPELTRAAKDLGYFNFILDADGTVRRIPLVIRYGEQLVPPLSLAILRQAIGQRARIVVDEFGVDEVSLGNLRIPVERRGTLRLGFRGPGRTFPHLSAVDVLRGRVSQDQLRDKIVLVGVTAIGVYDQRVTPTDPAFPGVEIHATVIDHVLQGRFLLEPWWAAGLEVASWLLLSFGVSWFVARTRGLKGVVASLVLMCAFVVLCQGALQGWGMVLPVVSPTLVAGLALIGGSVRRYVWEERERRKIRRALELYLSPAAAALVSEHPERLKLGGEKVDCTVLFSDVKNFTTLCEQLPAEVLVEFLNSYLGAMTEVVFAHGGMLDKYMGDGIMAVWGVPLVPRSDHAVAACRAALAMQNRLQQLLPEWRAKGWPELEIRIGINSGSVVFGNMGSAEHLSLTVVGDNVNLAARLEGLNKVYGTSILLAEATARALPESFWVREIDTVRVKGREQPVRVFELLGEGQQASELDKIRNRGKFAEALAAYRRGEFEVAERRFASLADGPRSDAAAQFFLTRCRMLLRTPPPRWDPITELDEK
ncbi:Adenylate cyclase 2 [bacterium HR30]|nr:Adenylate cyclase 2 [bacterium HR30]